jgi:hypothetical protein
VDAQLAAERQKQAAKAAGKTTGAKPGRGSTTNPVSGPGSIATPGVAGSSAGEAERGSPPEASR